MNRIFDRGYEPGSSVQSALLYVVSEPFVVLTQQWHQPQTRFSGHADGNNTDCGLWKSRVRSKLDDSKHPGGPGFLWGVGTGTGSMWIPRAEGYRGGGHGCLPKG